jgi:hypothetical protein
VEIDCRLSEIPSGAHGKDSNLESAALPHHRYAANLRRRFGYLNLHRSGGGERRIVGLQGIDCERQRTCHASHLQGELLRSEDACVVLAGIVNAAERPPVEN